MQESRDVLAPHWAGQCNDGTFVFPSRETCNILYKYFYDIEGRALNRGVRDNDSEYTDNDW